MEPGRGRVSGGLRPRESGGARGAVRTVRHHRPPPCLIRSVSGAKAPHRDTLPNGRLPARGMAAQPRPVPTSATCLANRILPRPPRPDRRRSRSAAPLGILPGDARHDRERDHRRADAAATATATATATAETKRCHGGISSISRTAPSAMGVQASRAQVGYRQAKDRSFGFTRPTGAITPLERSTTGAHAPQRGRSLCPQCHAPRRPHRPTPPTGQPARRGRRADTEPNRPTIGFVALPRR